MDRVAEVLQSLAIPVDEIANRSRLSGERVQQLIAGSKPTMGDLRALARGLRLPMRAFAGSEPQRSALSMQFRSLPKLSDDRHEPSQELVASFVSTALRLLPARSEPPSWLPHTTPSLPETFEVAERLAADARRVLTPSDQTGPIPNLPQLLESFGGVLVSQIRQSKYEGISLLAGNYLFVFISPRFQARMLFTAAHELGHYVAGHLQNAKFERPRDIGRGSSRSERFVDAFASCLLLPTPGFARGLAAVRSAFQTQSDAIGDAEILAVARFFGVSFETAAMRCEQLDLLPRGGAASLYEHLKRLHGSPEKRAAQLNLPPRQTVNVPLVSTTILKHAFKAVENGEISLTWLSDSLSVSIDYLNKSHAGMRAGDASAH